MKQRNRFIFDMLDLDNPEYETDRVWKGGIPESFDLDQGLVRLKIPFSPLKREGIFLTKEENKEKTHCDLVVRNYGDSIIRLTTSFDGSLPDDSQNPMFEWSDDLKQQNLSIESLDEGFVIKDPEGRICMKTDSGKYPVRQWSDLQPNPEPEFGASIFPFESTTVPFMAYDNFFPKQTESISLGFVEHKGCIGKCVFSFHAQPDEKFSGTGERFSAMNLAGKTIFLENTDALGVNTRRAYKNIPFFVSSRGYGVLIMTSSHVRLSFSDISTRAVQGVIEDERLDLFIIGGETLESIVRQYRLLTGFPRKIPDWSYGTWMARMSYFSADETREVVNRMREEKFPLDVIHLDSGWFEKDWKCEWKFSKKNFPEPEKFMAELLEKGVRTSLWQLPFIASGTDIYDEANEKGYIAVRKDSVSLESVFSAIEFNGTIDFSNPEAVSWYQGLLARLLEMGASVIKTDFGEVIEEDAKYFGLSYEKLHNLYSLLYHRSAFEISEQVKGKGKAMIWARAGWTGCQRYPVHWGGDCSSSWDGMAGTIRGGLHLGISGFAFWSHDIPGFHGVPSFMNSLPEEDLYVRWTQLGTFTSHMRYHGSNLREPYEYPAISSIVRMWLNLRYSLIPYIIDQGKKVTETGFPMFRALIFHHEKDPVCWNIDDEFYFGDTFLIAPLMNSEGKRSFYLPEGQWTDFWTGEREEGPVWKMNCEYPLERLPVFVKTGDVIRFYPEIVQSTTEMDFSKSIELSFDDRYRGIEKSVLGKIIYL